MGDFDKPVNRNEPAPYEKIIVNPIEKDKKTKEEFDTKPKTPFKSQSFATLFSYLKKILSTLSFKGKGPVAILSQQQLIDDVIAFRKLLHILSIEDQSHNPEFTQQLSELWHNLIDDCNSLSHPREYSRELIAKVKFFIAQVEHFPPNADHTLGYYFAEFAGKDWIPFPFMELLQQLHTEYGAHPFESVLHHWLALLDDILATDAPTEDL